MSNRLGVLLWLLPHQLTHSLSSFSCWVGGLVYKSDSTIYYVGFPPTRERSPHPPSLSVRGPDIKNGKVGAVIQQVQPPSLSGFPYIDVPSTNHFLPSSSFNYMTREEQQQQQHKKKKKNKFVSTRGLDLTATTTTITTTIYSKGKKKEGG